MKSKKEPKGKGAKVPTDQNPAPVGSSITSKAELESFLLTIRDKMEDGVAPPLYALSAMNHVMNLPGIYGWLDNETKEIARDIWLRLKQAGLQVINPPILFSEGEEAGSSR